MIVLSIVLCEKKKTWDLTANSLGYSRLSHRCINGPVVWIQRFVSALRLVSKSCSDSLQGFKLRSTKTLANAESECSSPVFVSQIHGRLLRPCGKWMEKFGWQKRK